MTDEIAQAVESGILDKKTADKLARLAPESFCTHKSWGFGRVAEWNLSGDQIVIDFKTKKGHPMQLAYAAETLVPIPANHILAQKENDPKQVKAFAEAEPVTLARQIISDLGGKATSDQFTTLLTPEVFTVGGFKKWWDSAKRAMKADGHFRLPTKKTDPYVLLEAPVNSGAGLLDTFRAARHSKDQLIALDQISKSIDDLAAHAGELQPLVSQIEDAASRLRRLQPATAIEMLLTRDELLKKFTALQSGAEAPTVASILTAESSRLGEVFTSIPGAKQKRVLESFDAAFGEAWSDKALRLLRDAAGRLIVDIHKLFEKHDSKAQFQSALERWISERSVSSEILIWLCKERGGDFPVLFNAELLSTVFSALEADMLAEKRSSRLRDLLVDDRELLGELLAGASRDVVRDSMRKLMLTPVFDDLSKRSLMARIVKLYPETQNMITGDNPDDRAENLTVSWASLEKRKAEFDNLTTKEIPQNLRDINIAKEQGDLRENAGFKAAKEHQRVLQRRRAEMEKELAMARGTDFENPNTSQVSIGTVVDVAYEDDTQDTFTILGAWDSAPDLGIVSYKAGIGQSLLGLASGSTVSLQSENGLKPAIVKSIKAFTDLDILRKKVHVIKFDTAPVA
jgi:transcription elongation GreA/GreB family factor